jgi:hypothetical protein
VAVFEPAGPSEFLHQFGKDAAVVSEDFEQQADDDPAATQTATVRIGCQISPDSRQVPR